LIPLTPATMTTGKRLKLGWVIGAIILLTGLSHFPLRHSQYVQDDHLAIERNRIIEHGDVREIFSTSYWEGASGQDHSLYRPVTILSYALERKLTGTPVAFVSQLINVALHILVSVALLLLARRLRVPDMAAATGAILFAVHPVHLEAVANIVGRAELLAALFSLIALLCLTYAGPWGKERSGPRARMAAWAAAGMVFLALGSKEIALALPLLFIALELLLRPVRTSRDRRWWIDRACAVAPMVVAAELYLWLRTSTLEMLVPVQRIHPLDNLTVDMSGIERWATSLGVLTRYLQLMCWPVNLAADYSGPVINSAHSLLGVWPLLGLATLLLCSAVVLAALTGSKTVQPGVAFWALLFLLPYLIIGNLFFPVGTIFAERLIYLPSAGVCMLAGIFAWTVGRRGSMRTTLSIISVVSIVVCFFIGLSWRRAQEWRDDETVFTAAVRVNPESPRSHYILGKLALERGDTATAIDRFRRTLEITPDHGPAWLEWGNALAGQQRFAEAETRFRNALRIAPGNATIRFNLALATRHQHRTAEAERWLLKARIADKRSGKILAELGNLYLSTQRYAEAAEAYREALRSGYTQVTDRLRQAERQSLGPARMPGSM
jgi:tetratricopeptide (TPR) repeat protein